MDYERPLEISQSNPKIHIALIMLMGVNHTISGPFSASPLLLGSGGPGGSGTQMIRSWGDRARFIAGLDQDVIGFDPRGIRASTPPTDCFTFSGKDASQSLLNRMTWNAAGSQADIINSKSDGALVALDSRIEMLGKLCKLNDEWGGDKSILRYVGTMNVVHDMASILDAWGIWISPKPHRKDESLTAVNLKYWGFSYGTLLGAAFAAVYPHRISRVALDGVLNVDTYINYSWKGHIQDLDKVLESFFHYCALAETRCKLYHSNDTASDIKTRFHGIMNSLKDRSLTLISPLSMMPSIVTYGYLKRYLFKAMFSPVDDFPRMAQLIDALAKQDSEFIIKELDPILSTNVCHTHQSILVSEAGQAVVCSDKLNPLSASLPDLSAIYDNLSTYSYFADVWMEQMLGCRHWNITTKVPPFPFKNEQRQINTSFPLLFVSNTADPVDPLEGGLNMTLRFLNAGFIEQRSEGHCSSSTLSYCTMKKVQSYFCDAIVPPSPVLGTSLATGKWDRCERDEWPWKPFDRDEWKAIRIARSNDNDKSTLEQIEEETVALQAWKDMHYRTAREDGGF